MKANKQDIELLESLYKGRKAYFGDFHNHSNSGGKSDGKYDLKQWREAMEELDMDFACILDHQQVRHMYLPEWDDTIFIGGSEPGTNIVDIEAEEKGLHYNMVFAEPKPLEKLLENFPEFKFAGGVMDGFFIYPNFTRARFCELVQFIKDNGGFFVHPHPKQIMRSNDPCDYWFGDETGIEVFYRNMRDKRSEDNYQLWCELLQCGKKVWACAGEDGHSNPKVNALTAIYSEEKSSKTYLSHVRKGDMICGSVGIKMCIGDCVMGGTCDFDGKNLVVSAPDFHSSVVEEGHKYKLVLLDDKGVVATEDISPDGKEVFSYKTEPCKFYRAEVFDETENLRIAVGNPIWNSGI